jgi:aminoglycoside phosphotransferase (APT) family kinase protein
MHIDELSTSPSLVARLLQQQFPQWAGLSIEPVESSGTDNALYRLGSELVVRMPRIHWAAGQAEKEHLWLPLLAPHLPLAIPVPLAAGVPGEGYPWHWSVCRWLEGRDASVQRPADERQSALDLARFVSALRAIRPPGEPPAMEAGSRGLPLAVRDKQTRDALHALEGVVDVSTATAVWEAALREAGWTGMPVLFHGDLLPSNILVQRGRLSAVIDFGSLGFGDPACDLIIAWGMLSAGARALFRETLAVDDATWFRGRGHALAQALIFMPYYKDTNPVGVRNARQTVAEVLADYQSNG